ncbi:MAG: AAA family ATPase, partial [Bacillota bacterium]
GELLISKVIANNDIPALNRYGITASDFPTAGERQALKFIVDYAEQNRGQAPSMEVVAGECAEFTPMPVVEDSYDFLVRKLKDHSAKHALKDLIEKQFAQKFNEGEGGLNLAKLLREASGDIIMRTDVRNKVGTDVKRDTSDFLDEYRKRKAGESFKIWRSKFQTINEQVGGYLSGNIYTWYGRSGRGKSVFTMEEALDAAMQGANVLVWALEMSKFEWMARAYSSLSARQGILTATIQGVDYEAGFENKALLMGGLSDEFESGFEIFLASLNERIPGNITVRAVDDEDFYVRGIKQLEADILQTKADVVVVDPIYYMDYEANTSKTAGGDVAATSKKLRHLAGRTRTVIHVITQAEEVRDDKGDDGERELRPPTRAEIKKTKAVLEDCVNSFGIDTLDGEGIIEIGKGRQGGEGTRVSVLYLPNVGIVRELETGEAAASQFNF